ncbi:MAG: hypothetical protein KDC85_24275 [Saprospiraceae bacterium]|nr:hypothetical protein [Saprospiraceae bacterium]MCB9326613.1 hypothetical protein [Lewinellaceae bacterium]
MEVWEKDFEWQHLRRWIKERFNKKGVPDLNSILFLIGIQELGKIQEAFSKEEKQDLMHIAICRLLSSDGHYKYLGKDVDGWPQWELLKPIDQSGVKNQEELLKTKIVEYFRPFIVEK